MNTSVSTDPIEDSPKSFAWGKLLFFLTAFVYFSAVIAGLVSVSVINSGRVVMGVQYAGTKLAGMTRDEVEQFFERTGNQKLANQAVRLSYGDRSWNILPEDIRLHANSAEAAESAYSVGRNGSFTENMLAQMRCALFGYAVELEAGYDTELLKQKLQGIATEIHTDPVNAFCAIDTSGNVYPYPGIVGKKLDTEALQAQIEPALPRFEFPQLALQPVEQPPFIKTEDIAAIDTVLAVYTTTFYPGERGENIILAASHLDNILIKSGNEFSFNDTVGPRTAKAGYNNAGVIIEGRMEQDIGGGVCQVSSTLYNAILLAGLTPTVRTAHFYPSAYCPPGLDATVADGLIDFRFRNSLKHNVYLRSVTDGSSLTIYVLGTRADLNGNTIRLETDGSPLSPSVYRIYSKNGEITEREFLHTDDYSEPVAGQ